MVSWGSPSGDPLEKADHDALLGAIETFDPLTLFPGTVILTVQGEPDRIVVQDKLVAVAQERGNGTRIRFAISPAMNGQSTYRGFLTSTIWPELNKRTG